MFYHSCVFFWIKKCALYSTNIQYMLQKIHYNLNKTNASDVDCWLYYQTDDHYANPGVCVQLQQKSSISAHIFGSSAFVGMYGQYQIFWLSASNLVVTSINDWLIMENSLLMHHWFACFLIWKCFTWILLIKGLRTDDHYAHPVHCSVHR